MPSFMKGEVAAQEEVAPQPSKVVKEVSSRSQEAAAKKVISLLYRHLVFPINKLVLLCASCTAPGEKGRGICLGRCG
jgi:hypothetical protein